MSRLEFVALSLVSLMIATHAWGQDRPVTAEREAFAGAFPVRVWEAPMVIPTYRVGPADPNPIFYTRESYQGAQKRVYPYPLQDALTHNRVDETYTALHLENEYVKLIVLPELGGRLFAATDKTNGYEFFYRQHVIKPALVGMLGAWISGGVEWCAFHHHRNTTFLPVDYELAENADGSATIWFGEIERRHRMKWLIGLTLHPGKSYIETTVKLFNRTAQRHSMLYWANVAVHVDENYQVIFPPSVRVATHHAKIDFTHWPISQGTYCGRDYTGTDISWYRNLGGPVSFFAWDLQEDFMGGYDHGVDAGVVHVGNHHIVCGAKLWSWGTGAAGELWDSILTDTDGPYVELMVGAYSDNQPDYSWIRPYETKVFTQYWYPVRGIGGFKNANRDGAVNLETNDDGSVSFGFHATSVQDNARACLTAGDRVIVDDTIDIGPGRPFQMRVEIPKDAAWTDLQASLISAVGEELIAYRPIDQEPVEKLPEPVEAPPKPQDIATIDELYFTGLRIEQIHNPAVDPLVYYREALARDPGDARCNTMMGMHLNKAWRHEEAETHLRRAIERITADYTRPANAEAYYQLGLALRAQGRNVEAYDSFYRATWDQALHSAAYQQLAELSCCRGDFERALEQIDRSLVTNGWNTRARNVKAIILRKLGRLREARDLANVTLIEDPLDFLAANELCLAERAMENAKAKAESADDVTGWHTADHTGETPVPQETGDTRNARLGADHVLHDLQHLMRGEVESYLELATDYMACGQWADAIEVLRRPVEAGMTFASTYPIVHYYLGYLCEQRGDRVAAQAFYEKGAESPSDYCFPFRRETQAVLEAAIRQRPEDARAYYYLGNLLFERQPERAIEQWEKSASLDDGSALTHRNLGWAYYRVENDVPRAIASYEKAVACDPNNARLFLELDMLYEIGNAEPQRRYAMLTNHHDVVRHNQDSLLREILVLVLVGEYDRAIEYLENHHFHAREGGKSIYGVYVDAHMLRGMRFMHAGKHDKALADFQRATESPKNLATPRSGRRAAEMAYHLGRAYAAMGETEKARRQFERGAARPGSSARPRPRYCHAMCLVELGRNDEAAKVFDDLIAVGKRKLTPREVVDYFAKFGEQETESARKADAHFTIGLGRLGQGGKQEAREQFEKAIELNRSHVWAAYHLSTLGQDR